MEIKDDSDEIYINDIINEEQNNEKENNDEIINDLDVKESQKKEEEEEEEEEEDEKIEQEKDILEKEINNKNNKKCSLKDHEDSDAINYCQKCKIFMCNKCDKVHEQLFKESHKNSLIKGYTGICEEKNHLMKLDYFCKTHNQLCCSSCLCKINTNGNGKHKDCDSCSIKKIKNEKKKKLLENLKFLENLSGAIEQSINELKQLFQKINENKENLKINIQNIFTKIRNSINNREDELLLEVDKKFDELFFKEELIKASEKLPEKIKISLEKGNINENDWKDKNKLIFLINDCINIENNIKEINFINETIKKCNSKSNLKINFNPKENEIEEFLKAIKNFGILNYDENINHSLSIDQNKVKQKANNNLFGKPNEAQKNRSNNLFGNPNEARNNCLFGKPNNLFGNNQQQKRNNNEQKKTYGNLFG